MTGWKQALFLGGAVLLLAACDRATGPSAQIREGKSAANSMLSPSLLEPTPSDTTTNPLDLCRNPVIISSGRTDDDTLSSDDCLLGF